MGCISRHPSRHPSIDTVTVASSWHLIDWVLACSPAWRASYLSNFLQMYEYFLDCFRYFYEEYFCWRILFVVVEYTRCYCSSWKLNWIFQFKVCLSALSSLNRELPCLQSAASALYYELIGRQTLLCRLPESIRSIINETTQLHACTNTLALPWKTSKWSHLKTSAKLKTTLNLMT